MLVEVGFEGERLVAFAAVVALGGRVRLHVSAQVGTVGEGLAAVGTAVRFLAGVRAHVTLEQPRAREGLATDGAHVRQGVRQQMHGQRRHGHVGLAAGRAGAGAARLQAAVRLLVTRQVGRRGVRLATLAAHVTTRARRTG